MYNSYGEIQLLKNLFTSKFDADKLFETVQYCKSGFILEFFEVKQLDKLKPAKILKLMSEYKTNVMRVYGGKTQHKFLQYIIDYCKDYSKRPDKKIVVGIKDLEWITALIEYNICNVYEFCRHWFELNKSAKDFVLSKCTFTTIKHFTHCFTDKDLAKYFESRPDMILLMKKPTQDMLRKYYSENPYKMSEVLVDNYPNDLLCQMIDDSRINTTIMSMNKNHCPLIEVYNKLCRGFDRFGNYGIDETNDEELKNYAQLVDNNIDLLKEYVKGRMLKD